MSIRTSMQSLSSEDTVIICDNYNSSSESLAIKAISFNRLKRKEQKSSSYSEQPITPITTGDTIRIDKEVIKPREKFLSDSNVNSLMKYYDIEEISFLALPE